MAGAVICFLRSERSRVESVHPGHEIIHDQAIGLVNGIGVKELADIAERADVEPLDLKHEAERIQDCRIVVDNKKITSGARETIPQNPAKVAGGRSAPFQMAISAVDGQS